MSHEGVTLQSILSSVSTRKDGSFKLTFETQEMSAEHGAALLAMRNRIGWLLFSSDELNSADIPDEQIEKEFDGDKTPSQRMRAVLFVYWQQRGKNGSFNDFYRQQMERWIDQIKDKLA